MDFTVTDHGSIVLVTPTTDECRDWLIENTAEDAQWFGHSLVVEPRYVDSLVKGLLNEGF